MSVTRWSYDAEALSTWVGQIHAASRGQTSLQLAAIDAQVVWSEFRTTRRAQTRVHVQGAIPTVLAAKLFSGVSLKLTEVPATVHRVTVTFTARAATSEQPTDVIDWPEEWNMPQHESAWTRLPVFPDLSAGGATSVGDEEEDDDEGDEDEEEEEGEFDLGVEDGEEDGEEEFDDDGEGDEDDDESPPTRSAPIRPPVPPNRTVPDWSAVLAAPQRPATRARPSDAPLEDPKDPPTASPARVAATPLDGRPATAPTAPTAASVFSGMNTQEDPITGLFVRWMERTAQDDSAMLLGILLLDERKRASQLEGLLMARMGRAEDQLAAAHDKLIQTTEAQGAREIAFREQTERVRAAAQQAAAEANQHIAQIRADAQRTELLHVLTDAKRQVEQERDRGERLAELFKTTQQRLGQSEEARQRAEQQAAARRRSSGKTEELLPDILTMAADKFFGQMAPGSTPSRKTRRAEEPTEESDDDFEEGEEEPRTVSTRGSGRRVARTTTSTRAARDGEAGGGGMIDQAVEALQQLGKLPQSVRRALLRQVAKREPGVIGEIAGDLTEMMEDE